MTKVSARLKGARVSDQKARLIANQIRGKHVNEAIDILVFDKQKSAYIVKKLLKSANANAQHNSGLDPNTLIISTISVDKSFTMKRIKPRARGRADRFFKRSCNINLTLTEEN